MPVRIMSILFTILFVAQLLLPRMCLLNICWGSKWIYWTPNIKLGTEVEKSYPTGSSGICKAVFREADQIESMIVQSGVLFPKAGQEVFTKL